MELIITCLLLAALSTCTGVTHWKLQNGLITAVNSGQTVFTAAVADEGAPSCSSCPGKENVVYDRVLAVLRPQTTQGRRRSEWHKNTCNQYEIF